VGAGGTRRRSDLLAVFAVFYRELSATDRLSAQKGSIFGGVADEKQQNISGQGRPATGANVGIGLTMSA
jgi:hypothetical protein